MPSSLRQQQSMRGRPADGPKPNLNSAAAEKIVTRVKKARQLLADHRKIGPAGLIPGTRRFVVKPYILTVRQRDGVVEIAAIRHAKQSDAYTPHEAMEDDETDEPETGSSFKID
jgi:plasmid stabilization system protein ParE